MTKEQPDVRVHVSTEHKTLGDAVFAAAGAAKRAAPGARNAMRTLVRIVAWLVAAHIALIAVVAAYLWIADRRESRKRERKEAAEAATAAAEAVKQAAKRRAVLDLLEPGLVPMLCPVAGEAIGRQLYGLPQVDARYAIGSCTTYAYIETPCSKVPVHDCTPATPGENLAWDRAFADRGVAAARRAVVGADPNPRIPLVDPATGQLYEVDRDGLGATLYRYPSWLPATPKQVTAWESAR